MNCIQARKLVTPFVEKQLSEKTTEQFLRHVEHCDDCMDELDIYYTVYKALESLDAPGSQEFDFRKMMMDEIRSTRRNIRYRRIFRVFRRGFLLITELLILLSCYAGYQLSIGNDIPLHHHILNKIHGTVVNEKVVETESEALNITESR